MKVEANMNAEQFLRDLKRWIDSGEIGLDYIEPHGPGQNLGRDPLVRVVVRTPLAMLAVAGAFWGSFAIPAEAL